MCSLRWYCDGMNHTGRSLHSSRTPLEDICLGMSILGVRIYWNGSIRNKATYPPSVPFHTTRKTHLTDRTTPCRVLISCTARKTLLSVKSKPNITHAFACLSQRSNETWCERFISEGRKNEEMMLTINTGHSNVLCSPSAPQFLQTTRFGFAPWEDPASSAGSSKYRTMPA